MIILLSSSTKKLYFHKPVCLAHLMTSKLFSCNFIKIDLTYKSHEKKMPFRRSKKGLWEQKKTMNNYFSTYLSRLLFLGKDDATDRMLTHTLRGQKNLSLG